MSNLARIRGWLLIVPVSILVGLAINAVSILIMLFGFDGEPGYVQAYGQGVFDQLSGIQYAYVISEFMAAFVSLGLAVYLLWLVIKGRKIFALALTATTAVNLLMWGANALFYSVTFEAALQSQPSGGSALGAIALLQFVLTNKRARAYFVN